jgi:bifunctional UDP-N-acetylglucosamine pyrophosphorylase/glucosamine-1-phosphate N-acetyltransferase
MRQIPEAKKKSMTTMAAIILAAGEGTRMKSTSPKLLHPILGVPMIFHVLAALRPLGRMPVILVTGFGGDVLQREIAPSFRDLDLRFTTQKTREGTGHAVKVALKSVPAGVSDVLVLMGDMPMVSTGSMRKIIDLHLRTHCVITIATAMLDDPSGYGRVMRSFSGKVIGIKEDRDCADPEKDVKEVNTGVYCFSLPLLRASIPKLHNDNAKKEYYLTDLVHMAASEPTGNVGSVRIPSEEANGINDRYQASEAEQILLGRLLRQLMRDGVSILRPGTVYIENAARISPDTVLEPSVMVKGKTVIGKACIVGAGSILADTVVEDQAVIGPYCILEGATVRSGSRLEPFTKMLRRVEKQPQGRVQGRGQGQVQGQDRTQVQDQGQGQDQGRVQGQGQRKRRRRRR